MAMEIRKCEVCGNEKLATPRFRFCTQACKKVARRKRLREEREQARRAAGTARPNQ